MSNQGGFSLNDDWLGRWARFYEQFGRFLRDALGAGLIAFALTIIFALFKWASADGALVALSVSILRPWFGWGGIFVAAGIAYLGFALLQYGRSPVRWGRFLALELAALLTLGLLAAFGGNDLSRAEVGMDGGRLGWSIARLFWQMGKIPGTLILFILWALAAATGLGAWSKLETWLIKIAGDEAPILVSLPQPQADVEAEEEAPVAESSAASKKKEPLLPPEFRPQLKSDNKRSQKSNKPIKRGEDLPPLTLLMNDSNARADERTINQTAGLIMKTLSEFGIPTTVVGFKVGPSVTQFAVQPGFIKKGTEEEDMQLLKVRVAQIASLQKDLALALSAQRLRIEAPVPGKPYVGIEVPNLSSATVRLRSLLENEAFYKVGSPLGLALGRDVSGNPVNADLARMPHLLIAGSTGSGKSVCITAIAACLAMNNTPEELRMIMIDSKMVELIRYNGLPHLYGKVETSLDRILGVLRWIVVEMEHRYRLLEAAHARDLTSYNKKAARSANGEPLPRIVVLIDELADLMMSAPDQTEHNLVRLAQMARATGIHLVVATQRPSTDVVTGLIKANFPARLAFAVASGTDSRVILDYTGAESLLGRGDMLFLNPEVGMPTRAQGAMITDMEIERVIDYWKKNWDDGAEKAPPWESLLQEPQENEDDGLIEKAISIVRQQQRASASMLQRRLRIGYPRAARLLDQLEEMGVVGPSQGGGREREVLLGAEDELENGEA